MNLLLLGAVSLPVGYLAYGYAYLFVPPKIGGGGGGQSAKDATGNDVKSSVWLKTHQPGARELTQGLKGDATYLIVTEQGEIEKYGLNAVCTHLGCVVPWNKAENKFMCPCHGSQYDATGKKVRGPAPLSLALAHAEINDDVVFFSPWTEELLASLEAGHSRKFSLIQATPVLLALAPILSRAAQLALPRE